MVQAILGNKFLVNSADLKVIFNTIHKFINYKIKKETKVMGSQVQIHEAENQHLHHR